MEFKFGEVVKHTTKDFKGIVIGQVKYYDDCILYGIFYRDNDNVTDWFEDVLLESTNNIVDINSEGMKAVLPKIKGKYL